MERLYISADEFARHFDPFAYPQREHRYPRSLRLYTEVAEMCLSRSDVLDILKDGSRV